MARHVTRFTTYFSFVRFSHSVFALPFALAGALLATRHVPVSSATWQTGAWILVAMAVAPVGGWLAVGGRSGGEPWMLALAIGTWVGGFDVLYACQDLEFDRSHGLRSIPVRFGVPASLLISRTMHVVTIAALLSLTLVTPLPRVYILGVLGVAALLAYEQSLVSADDLSQVKRAFDLNGYVGILYFIVLAVSVYGG